MSEFFASFESPDPTLSLVIEDDGRVAYAYLVVKNEVVGDVWLYNQSVTPVSPEWPDESKAPFLNPATYVNQPDSFMPIVNEDELAVKWVTDGSIVTAADICIRGVRHATVGRMQKPGACRFARQDGPLAATLPNQGMVFFSHSVAIATGKTANSNHSPLNSCGKAVIPGLPLGPLNIAVLYERGGNLLTG